jgi:hypothetical protein
VEFVFAPEERDVYSTSAHPKVLAPLGAKPGSGTIAEAAKAIALLQSFGVKKDRQAINISPLWGEATKMFCCTSNLNSRMANEKW